MDPSLETNWFQRHPFAAFAIFWLIGFAILEAALRIINPSFVSFPHRLRQVIKYHPQWKAEHIPNTRTWIRLVSSGQIEMFNFLVTIGPDGFRTWDRELDNNSVKLRPGTRIIHAIGDSLTMGWGLNFESTYPATLDFLLGANHRVLNLGLNGYGTRAATEKSLSLWQKYPASLALYLYCDNDYEDDELAGRHSGRTRAFHMLLEVWNLLRQNTYLANLPYAVYEWGYWEQFRSAGIEDFVDHKIICASNQADIRIVSPATKPSNDNRGKLSKAALLRYKKFLELHNVPLLVLCFGLHENCNDFYMFCLENNVRAYLLDVPPELRLLKDGHFNQLGSYKMAKLLRDLIQPFND